MDEFHPMIYLFNPILEWNSSMKNDIHPYEITLNFKLQAQALGSCTSHLFYKVG
jgi:hypothetical protein